MEYKKAKLLAFFIFAAYAGVAMILRGPVQDVYPVFSWSLFSIIPNPGYRYTVEVMEANGERHNPPLRFSQSSYLFKNVKHSLTEYTPRIERLGRALAHGETNAVAEARKSFEAIFGEQPFRYRVLMIDGDPLAYWRSGSYAIVRTLGVFSSDERP